MLPRIHDPRGNLTFAQDYDQVPFAIHRAFWIYDIPAGCERGAHAHRKLYQAIIALAGSFTVTVTDGVEECQYTLNRPYEALLVVPGIWSHIDNYSSGAVCMVLVSAPFDEADYIRDYDDYLKYVGVK